MEISSSCRLHVRFLNFLFKASFFWLFVVFLLDRLVLADMLETDMWCSEVRNSHTLDPPLPLPFPLCATWTWRSNKLQISGVDPCRRSDLRLYSELKSSRYLQENLHVQYSERVYCLFLYFHPLSSFPASSTDTCSGAKKTTVHFVLGHPHIKIHLVNASAGSPVITLICKCH